MKTFNVNATVKGEVVNISIPADTKQDAKQIAMNILGYEMNGEFFPLHWSEINYAKRTK